MHYICMYVCMHYIYVYVKSALMYCTSKDVLHSIARVFSSSVGSIGL